MKLIKDCPNCQKQFESEKRNRRKFCSQSCSASYGNKNGNRNKLGKIKKNCLDCKVEFKPKRYTQEFCSSKCFGTYKSKSVYETILNGTCNSINPSSAKKYILEEQNSKCAICKMKNEWNNKNIVFVLDHIDGDASNNKRENLRLVCPNCDSQLDTYKSKNKGKGRFSRKQRYKEGKSS